MGADKSKPKLTKKERVTFGNEYRAILDIQNI